MIDWFDIFMKVITCFALFSAGYQIGWQKGYESLRKRIESPVNDLIKAMSEALVKSEAKGKTDETHNKSEGSDLS